MMKTTQPKSETQEAMGGNRGDNSNICSDLERNVQERDGCGKERNGTCGSAVARLLKDYNYPPFNGASLPYLTDYAVISGTYPLAAGGPWLEVEGDNTSQRHAAQTSPVSCSYESHEVVGSSYRSVGGIFGIIGPNSVPCNANEGSQDLLTPNVGDGPAVAGSNHPHCDIPLQPNNPEETNISGTLSPLTSAVGPKARTIAEAVDQIRLATSDADKWIIFSDCTCAIATAIRLSKVPHPENSAQRSLANASTDIPNPKISVTMSWI
ncbi:hypothetical protein DFH27DRAFT_641433 [Peziza echinospora]|nr:hypothetical protein DFH27DRAFT_641433 [Peziza echinospora]